MSGAEWIEANLEGLSLMFHNPKDEEDQDKAIDAMLEVLDLEMESWGYGRGNG